MKVRWLFYASGWAFVSAILAYDAGLTLLFWLAAFVSISVWIDWFISERKDS